MSSEQRRWFALATLGAVLFVGASCGDDSKPKSGGESSSTSAKPGSAPTVSFAVGDASAGTFAGPVPLSEDLVSAVLKPVHAWAQDAIVEGFATGTAQLPDGIFDDPAGSAAAQDVGVLTENGLPRATGPVTITLQNANLTAIGDPARPSVVGVLVTLTVQAPVAGGTLESTRIAEFSLKDLGGWKIVAYDVGVNRSGPGVSTAQQAERASNSEASK